MLNDAVNYVRQGVLIASALICIQHTEATCPKVCHYWSNVFSIDFDASLPRWKCFANITWKSSATNTMMSWRSSERFLLTVFSMQVRRGRLRSRDDLTGERDSFQEVEMSRCPSWLAVGRQIRCPSSVFSSSLNSGTGFHSVCSCPCHSHRPVWWHWIKISR